MRKIKINTLSTLRIFAILSFGLISSNASATFWDKFISNSEHTNRVSAIIKTDIKHSLIYIGEHASPFRTTYGKQIKLIFNKSSQYNIVITGVYEKNYQTYDCKKKISHTFEKEEEILEVKLRDNCKLRPKKELDKSEIRISNSIVTQNNFKYKAYISVSLPHININKDIKKYLKIYEISAKEDKEIKYYVNNNTSWNLKLYAQYKPQTTYKIVFKKGFETKTQLVRIEKTLLTKFANLPEKINFEKGSAENYIVADDEALGVNVVNIDNLQVTIYKIIDKNINYAKLFSGYYYTDKLRLAEKIANYPLTTHAKKNTQTTLQVNFKKYLQHQTGVFIVVVKGKDSYQKIHKIVVKSNIGTLAKVSANQIFISTNSLKDNTPIVGADVAVYSGKNKLILSGKTGKDGIFIQNYQNLNKEQPTLVVVKNANDISTLNISQSSSISKYAAFIDIARNMIRPSESLTINTVVRSKDLLPSTIKNAKLIIKNPNYKTIAVKNISLDNNGVGQYIFKTTNEMKTGQYNISVKVGSEVVADNYFLIETFIPQKIKVDVFSDKNTYNFDDVIKLNLSAKYLFGGSGAKLKANISAKLSGSNYQSKNFNTYEFNNTSSFNASSNNEDIVLDDSGKWIKEYSVLDKKNNLKINKAQIKVNTYASMSDYGRKIRKNTVFFVKPFADITGIKKTQGCFVAGESVKFDIATINSKTDAKITQKKYSINVVINKKTYHYYAGLQTEQILNEKTANNGKFIFENGEIGEYEIIVKNPNGQSATTNFCISGNGWTAFNAYKKKSYNVEIKTNKKIVTTGEKINVSVKSPIPGKLILTFEENSVKHYQVFTMNGNNFNTDIVVPKTIINGFYLSALVVRDTSTDNNILPYKVSGNTYIKLDKHKNKAKININSIDVTKSNSTLTVNIATNAPYASAVVSIVDNGILNITNFTTPNYFKNLTKKLYNFINNFTIYNTLLSPTKLLVATVGGGAFEAKSSKKYAKNLTQNDINKRVKPFVWTSKIITLDSEGKVRTNISIPDYNGSAKLKVIVAGSNRVGNNEKDIIIKDDIIIKTTLPRFLIKGDEFDIPVRIFNNTNGKQTLKLQTLTSKHLQVLSDLETMALDGNQNKLITIKVKAIKTGLAHIKLYSGEFFNNTNILVKSNYDYNQVSVNGIIKSNDTKKFDLSQLANDEKSLAQLSISTSPYNNLSKDAKYLIRYPHGCAEQTSSKLLALLYAKTILSDNKDNQKLFSKRQDFIEDGIIKLSNMQNNSGRFTYWQGSSGVNDYASLYALSTLKKLDNSGFQVPSSVLLAGNKTLGNGFNAKYPFMVLEINRDITLANYLYDNNKYQNSIYKSVLLASIMYENTNIEATQKLLSYAQKIFNDNSYSKNRRYDGGFYSDIKEIARSLSVYAKNFSKDDTFALNLLSVINTSVVESKLYSTQDKAFVMQALYDYYGKNLTTTTINNIVNINGKKTNNNIEYFKNLKLDKNDTLSINNKGDAIYYGLDLRIPTLHPVNTNNVLDFQTTLVDNNLDKVNTIKLGDELLVKVEVTSSQDIKNIASIINIPAGLEIVNERLYNTHNKYHNQNYHKQHTEYRDDKVISYIDLYNNETTIYYIKVAATTQGVFNVPSSYIEAMYDSRINASYKFSPNIVVKNFKKHNTTNEKI